MKILIYTTYHDTFLEDIVYLGLLDFFGASKIFSLQPADPNSQSIELTRNKNAITSYEALERLDEFDLILFFNNAFFDKYFIEVLNKQTSAIKVFIDGIDDFFVRKIYYHPEIKYYFKRELYKRVDKKLAIEWYIRYSYELLRAPKRIGVYGHWFSHWNMPIGIADMNKFKMLKPFPLTVPVPEKSTKRKIRYDVSFVGHANNPERNKYLEYADKFLKNVGAQSKISTKIVSKKEYIKLLLQSKASLVLRGTGYDTWRYWEAPAYGTALLAKKSPILIPNDFIDEESALYFDSFEELKYKINKYILKSNEWKEIAKNGHIHFLKYHTPKERVKELLLKYLLSE